MPYRVRGLNLGGYLAGMAEANAIRTRGNESLHRGILSGLLSIGEGIDTRRTEKESKRRFGLEEARAGRAEARADWASERADAELAMQYQKQLADEQERQVNDMTTLDELDQLAGRANVEHAETGQVTPQTTDALKKGADYFGGPQEVVQRFLQRASGKT